VVCCKHLPAVAVPLLLLLLLLLPLLGGCVAASLCQACPAAARSTFEAVERLKFATLHSSDNQKATETLLRLRKRQDKSAKAQSTAGRLLLATLQAAVTTTMLQQ
jgi:hypothetical protein